tara:strand:+ start:495 stop:1013 length:519 start_codon:yes stop_codon:yes gene_type:complete
MPKKSARRSVKQCNALALHADVRPWEMGLGGEPLEDRDHRYVPCVSPKTEMQRQFIEAIDAFHLVLALGPAGTIEIALVGYMRGRILNRSFLVIDKARNCTLGQVKMLLTRLGWNSTMVVMGDPDQTDLLPGMAGLPEVADLLDPFNDVAITWFSNDDVVRYPLVSTILDVV